jgi:hypothetical protein
MQGYSEDLVDMVRSVTGVELDYSLGSVEQLEEFIDVLVEAVPSGLWARVSGQRHRNLRDFAKALGGYSGEVLRRERGGTWEFDRALFPAPTAYGLRGDYGLIWPTARAQLRIENGISDSLYAYLQRV